MTFCYSCLNLEELFAEYVAGATSKVSYSCLAQNVEAENKLVRLIGTKIFLNLI